MDSPPDPKRALAPAEPADDAADVQINREWHDLANFLGVILGNADLALADLGENHPVADNLREILHSARDARALCRRMRGPAEDLPRRIRARPRAEGLRFLLLDDDAAFLSLSERALRRLGYEVSAFSSPAEALRIFDANPSDFDIFITDMHIPEATGLQIASDFLERAPGLCVCLTSGDVDDDLRKEAKRVGILVVLRKPNTIEEFVTAVRLLAESTILRTSIRKSARP